MARQLSPDDSLTGSGSPSDPEVVAIQERLRKSGIYPYGSDELRLYENRLTRFFTREYQRLKGKDTTLEDLGISTREGPMWEETDELMEQHYDERIELFQNFLDSRFMAYTMAYYGETAEQVLASTVSLEEAQRAKFKLICDRAGITGSEHVFSVGCGFGPLETFLLETYPKMNVVSITPSKVQASFIRERMTNRDHPLGSGRLELIEGDFGEVPISRLGENRYEIVFAIGVFEHVHNMQAAFERMASLLKPDGKAFLHFISSRRVIPQFLDARRTLIGKYFPGGHIWPFSEVQSHRDYFQLEGSWFVNGLNYWRTLDEWHKKFWANIDKFYGAVLDDGGIRHWNEYFSLCKVLFPPMEGTIYGNAHYLLRKKAQ